MRLGKFDSIVEKYESIKRLKNERHAILTNINARFLSLFFFLFYVYKVSNSSEFLKIFLSIFVYLNTMKNYFRNLENSIYYK